MLSKRSEGLTFRAHQPCQRGSVRVQSLLASINLRSVWFRQPTLSLGPYVVQIWSGYTPNDYAAYNSVTQQHIPERLAVHPSTTQHRWAV